MTGRTQESTIAAADGAAITGGSASWPAGPGGPTSDQPIPRLWPEVHRIGTFVVAFRRSAAAINSRCPYETRRF
ncbi:hypothetical protein AB0F52_46490, partial [Amycolatopsis sp. NPDC024027]|uniref:hypothetical protein n=1 Tax=Amycolatopsis sp. NPDC024027 TaxID=3154327 RepID=UPI0033CCF0EC